MANVLIRPMIDDDKVEVVRLLAQLTSIDGEQFKLSPVIDRFVIGQPKTFVAIDMDGNKIVGCVSALIEQKMIHGHGKCCHLEDLVVDQHYRGLGIASQLIDEVRMFANYIGCYKIVLGCTIDLQYFYEKNSFEYVGSYMREYL